MQKINGPRCLQTRRYPEANFFKWNKYVYIKFVSYANILSAAFTINMLNAPPLFL